MLRTIKLFTLILLVTLTISLFCCVKAEDINATSVSSGNIVVRAANNDGMGFDIKGYKKGKEIYLFLPADVDASNLLVTFGGTTKQLDLTSSKTARLSDGSFTIIVMHTNLPVLNMNIDESQGTIAAMNQDPNHDTKCFGTFYLDVPTELAQKNGWEEYYTDAHSEIKGRGNATWNLEKKAYQIKLDKKQNILEMGKDKTWIILANHGDRSLIRNKLAYDFAKDIGLEYSLDSEFVDVYFNGEYQGNYLLTEKVEIGKERVNIYDLEEKDENTDADRVTGGYLIEYDRLAREERTWTVGPNTGRLITIKSPEEANEEQKAYITNLINNMENAIYAENGKSPEGKHYSEYMDVDSFIKLYWINEIFKNGDFFYGSTFMYKDVGVDEKLFSGPAWDFDITIANACSNAGASTPARQANLASPVGWWARTIADGFTKYLFTHEDFRLRNKEIYDETVAQFLMNLPVRAQEYATYIQKSADMNFVRWDILKQDHQWMTPNRAVTYNGEVEFVKNYLTQRAEWIDRTMNSNMASSNLGTEQNPITIANADDLKKFRDEVNAGDTYMGYYFRQTADIDLDGEEFVPIGMNTDGFMGNYDGGGYSIKNLKITVDTINDNTLPAGFFANVYGGEICNVNIESGVIDVVAREVGGVIGRMNGAKVYNCTNRASVTNRADGNFQMTGGIVGHMVSGSQNYLIHCINYGDVDAPNAVSDSCRGVGGVVGHASTGGVISGVVNLGKVSVSFAHDGLVGGIIGELSGNRTRVSYAYWLNDEDGIENGQGVQTRTDSNSGISWNSFSGMGLSREQINSESFVHEMNLYLVTVAQTGGLDYHQLKMWQISDRQLALTVENAQIDKLPKFPPEWVMSNRSIAFRWMRSTSGVKAEIGDGTIDFVKGNRNPITSINLAVNEQFSADEYHYAAIKMKVSSTVNYGGIFFGTDKFHGPTAECYSKFEVKNDGRWHDYIIDMSAYEHDRWHGTVNFFRLDPINDEDIKASVSIERIGLFRTEQDAQVFLDESPKMSMIFTDDIQTVYFSDNVAKSGGDKSKYILANNNLDEEKPHENAHAVVSYTDNGGNVIILPICFTDTKLYSYFMVNEPGIYKLTYKYKAYSDTDGHWAEEYIDFVSARGLFVGTSPTQFSPDENMTRGMFITLLGRMHGVESAQYDGLKSGFDDVRPSEYYAPYVQWANENGLVNTFLDRNFHPDSPIRREDMAEIIYRYINKQSYSLERISEPINFIDISNLSNDAQLFVQTIQRCGIINGKGNNTFDPAGYSTRAEVSAVITRLIKAILGVLE